MGRRQQKIGAFSLVEALLAAFLAGLLLLLFLQVLVPAFRISSETSLRSELLQRGNHAMKSLSKDLSGCPQSGVLIYVQPSRTIMSLHQVVDADPEGVPLYSPALILYVWESEELKRYEYEDSVVDFQASLQRPTAATISSYLTSARGPKILCKGLLNFSVTDADPSPTRFEPPLQLNMELLQGRADKPVRLVLSKKLTLRNS